MSFLENADGGFARVTVEREEGGCIPGAQKEVMWLGWWRGCWKELRIKDGSSSVGKKYVWCSCPLPQS